MLKIDVKYTNAVSKLHRIHHRNQSALGLIFLPRAHHHQWILAYRIYVQTQADLFSHCASVHNCDDGRISDDIVDVRDGEVGVLAVFGGGWSHDWDWVGHLCQ